MLPHDTPGADACKVLQREVLEAENEMPWGFWGPDRIYLRHER